LAKPVEFEGTSRFAIRRRIGAGGMGVVYSAFDHERGETIALKTLRRFEGASLRRLKQEFRALADVNHPNLVALHELVCDEEWFFTMELVDGFRFTDYVNARMNMAFAETSPAVAGSEGEGSDADVWFSSGSDNLIVRSHGVPPPCTADIERLKSCLVQLAAGLSALHDAGKLHRDIKPSNVLVSHEGRVVILDFGLVTELETQRRAKAREALVAGTAEYMAPEQGAGLPLTQASDWYATGVVMYEALTGSRPFRGGVREVLIEKQRRDPVTPSELASRVPKDLEQLCMRLLSRDPKRRPTGEEIVRALGADRAAVGGLSWQFPAYEDVELIGRGKSMATLDAAFESVCAGGSRTVFIHGSSGMGKSALTRAFIDRLRDEQLATVLTARCHERESVPYKAVDSVVDALVQHLLQIPSSELASVLPDHLGDLARLFPVLLEICAIAEVRPAAVAPDPLELRERAFDAVRQLVLALGREQPIVICVDDLHWGDADSAALLAHLVRAPDAPRVLVVACYRTEETAIPVLLERLIDDDEAASKDEPVLLEIELGPISRADSIELALETFDRDDPTAVAWAELIADEAGGNPFFVRELANQALLDQPPHAVSLGEIMAARIEQLPIDARRVLELICVAGQPVTQGAVLIASELHAKGRLAIQQLRASHLVRSRGAQDTDAIEPYHDRIRVAVETHLDEESFASHHAMLGAALETTKEGDAETLAMHYAEAGQPAKAALFAEEAADKASRALAFDRAAQLYRRTLELRERATLAISRVDSEISVAEALSAHAGSAVDERRRLLERLGEALANDGRGAEAAQAFSSAADIGGSVELRRRAAEQLLRSGRVDEGLKVLGTVLSEVGLDMAPTPRRALTALVRRRAQLRLRGLAFTERREDEVSEDELTKIDTCWSVAAGLSTVDNIRGANFQTRHLLLALAAGEPYRVVRALATEAAYAGNAGGAGRKRAATLIRSATELADRVGHPHALGLVAAVTGIVAYQEGRFRAAFEYCSAAERTFRDRCTGVAWEMETAQIFGTMAMAHLGRLRALSRRVPGLLAAAHARGDLYAGTNFRLGYPNLAWLVTGNGEGAKAVALDALTHWSARGFNAQHFYGLLALVNADLYEGDGPRALVRVRDAWPALSKSLLLRVQFLRIEALWFRARANVAAATVSSGRDRKKRIAEAERDARKIAKERMAWAEPLAALVLAGVSVQKDDPSAAVIQLRAALRGFEAAEMAAAASVSGLRLGELVGGEEGDQLAERFRRFMIEQDVRRPDQFASMLAPGF